MIDKFSSLACIIISVFLVRLGADAGGIEGVAALSEAGDIIAK